MTGLVASLLVLGAVVVGVTLVVAGVHLERMRVARLPVVVVHPWDDDEAVRRVVELVTPGVVAKVREEASSDEWDAWKRTYGPSYVEAAVTNARRKGGA